MKPLDWVSVDGGRVNAGAGASEKRRQIVRGWGCGRQTTGERERERGREREREREREKERERKREREREEKHNFLTLS